MEWDLRLCIVKVILYIVLWRLLNITGEWKSIQYFGCGLETPLSTAAKSAPPWVMEKMWLEFRSLRFQEENFTSAWQKQLGFYLWINRFGVWASDKDQDKDLNKLKIHKPFSKVIIRANQKDLSIPPTSEYLNLQNICYHLVVGYWEIACGNGPEFQKTGVASGMQGLVRFALQHGWPFIT